MDRTSELLFRSEKVPVPDVGRFYVWSYGGASMVRTVCPSFDSERVPSSGKNNFHVLTDRIKPWTID